MPKDGRYAAGAWMHRSGDPHGWPYAVKYKDVRERRCTWMGGRALKDGESENGFTQNKLEARI